MDAAAPSLEEVGVEMPLQGADAVAGGGGDAELLAGRHEAPVAGGGLEEAQAVEGFSRERQDKFIDTNEFVQQSKTSLLATS